MADQKREGKAEPEYRDNVNIWLGWLRVKLTGSPATIATTGSLAIAAFCAYKVLSNEELCESIIAHAFKQGCVVIDFIAKNEKAANQALRLFSSNEILESFNKALEEYSKKQKHPTGKFNGVEIVSFIKNTIKAIKWSKLKKEADKLREKFEKELDMTFETLHQSGTGSFFHTVVVKDNIIYDSQVASSSPKFIKETKNDTASAGHATGSNKEDRDISTTNYNAPKDSSNVNISARDVTDSSIAGGNVTNTSSTPRRKKELLTRKQRAEETETDDDHMKKFKPNNDPRQKTKQTNASAKKKTVSTRKNLRSKDSGNVNIRVRDVSGSSIAGGNVTNTTHNT